MEWDDRQERTGGAATTAADSLRPCSVSLTEGSLDMCTYITETIAIPGSAKVRVVVSRSELPPVDHQDQPPAPHGIPSMVIVDKPELHAVIYLGSLADLLSPLTKARQET